MFNSKEETGWLWTLAAQENDVPVVEKNGCAVNTWTEMDTRIPLEKLLFKVLNHVLHGWFHTNDCVNPCCGLRKTNKNVYISFTSRLLLREVFFISACSKMGLHRLDFLF